MSGLELIAAALAAGATAGVSNTASAAVQDAYVGLKAAVARCFDDGSKVRQALQADETEPEVWANEIGAHLKSSGAATDEQVLAAAHRLLELARSEAARRGVTGESYGRKVAVEGDYTEQNQTFNAYDHSTQYNVPGGSVTVNNSVERRSGS